MSICGWAGTSTASSLSFNSIIRPQNNSDVILKPVAVVSSKNMRKYAIELTKIRNLVADSNFNTQGPIDDFLGAC